MALLLSSCVPQYPDVVENRNVTLHVHHELPWDLFEWTRHVATRDAFSQPMSARYIIGVYPAGTTTDIPLRKMTIYRQDIERADFDIDIEVPVGDWDIRIWTDNAPDSGLSPFYVADDFSNLTYNSPFIGASKMKDAFEGTVAVSVPKSEYDVWEKSDYYVELRRPLCGYAFIATDLKPFIEHEEFRMRGKTDDESVPPVSAPSVSLSDYDVRIDYSGFLPSVYNHFSGRPIDSSTGVSYYTSAIAISDTEALIGYDFVFINGEESTVRAELNLYHKDGTHIASFSSFGIPVKRNQCTIVRGEFLTSKASGGTGIDPGFEGEFNIEYR